MKIIRVWIPDALITYQFYGVARGGRGQDRFDEVPIGARMEFRSTHKGFLLLGM